MSTTLTPSTDEVRIYECSVLLPASLNDKEEGELVKNVKELFEEKGGKLLHSASWGRMGLAYRIKGNSEGKYLFFYYEMDPTHVQELDKSIRLEKGVLRHMLMRVPDNYEIIDWTKHLEEWKQTAEKREAEKAVEKEEEIKKKIVKRASKKVEDAAPAKKEEVEEKELAEKLGELISDEDLNL